MWGRAGAGGLGGGGVRCNGSNGCWMSLSEPKAAEEGRKEKVRALAAQVEKRGRSEFQILRSPRTQQQDSSPNPSTPSLTATRQTAMDRPLETVVPVAHPAAGPTTNPLLSLLAALARATLYLLSVFRQLVGFCTITLPLVVVNVLSWSWTFQVRLSC